MTNHRLSMTVLALVAGITMAGCDSGSSSSTAMPSPPAPTPPPPPPPAATNFTGFVIDQFGATADNIDPVQVDGTDFAFDDEDNPRAFDGLLSDS